METFVDFDRGFPAVPPGEIVSRNGTSPGPKSSVTNVSASDMGVVSPEEDGDAMGPSFCVVINPRDEDISNNMFWTEEGRAADMTGMLDRSTFSMTLRLLRPKSRSLDVNGTNPVVGGNIRPTA